jgi:flavin-dependent dehydrogenase
MAPETISLSAASRTERYDAIVVGARVAGAATAMMLARRNLRVLLVDRARPGTDTLSTHALMRGGVYQLQRWGLLDRVVEAGTPPVRRTTFRYEDGSHEIPIKAKGGVDALYAPRRTVLDPILATAAEEAGADVRFGVTVTGLLRDATGRVTGIEARDRAGRTMTARAPVTVGADGLNSFVARTVRAPVYRRGANAGAFIFGYWSGLENDGYEWCYRPGVGAGLIPTNDGQTVAWVGASSQRFFAELRRDLHASFHQVLAEAAPADVVDRVTAARRTSPLRGFPGVPGFLRQPAGPGWALVGDAGYFKDPITAHGITDALRDADLLARAVSAGGDPEALTAYQHRRDAMSIPLLAASDQIASYQWDMPRLRELLLDMNKAMNAEFAELQDLDGLPLPVAA